MKLTILKGHFIFTKTPEQFTIHESSYLVAVDGKVEGIYATLPEKYQDCKVEDHGNNLIIPGFVDLHLHAAQYPQCGIGMTKQLLDWLEDYTFNLEKEYQDPEFAREVYTAFVNKLIAVGTLRACVFASTSTAGTEVLFEVCKKKGIGAYIGKVNMDSNAPHYIIESTEASLRDTEYLLKKYAGEKLVKPIITPRFAPTCSKDLLSGLGQLALTYQVPVQSHLSENRDEIQWVLDLFPDSQTYGDVYHKHNLFGQTKTLMAHGIYLEEREKALLQQKTLTLVHCPDSNINLRSGIMPVREYLNMGIQVGLGSDIGGSHKIAMNETIARAIQLSKLFSIQQESASPLSISEAFFMATKQGGNFFGKVGSFEAGYSLDALVLEDDPLVARRYSLEDRLEKFIYTGDDRNIVARYIEGAPLVL